MVTPEIISYIKSERAKNISDSDIKAHLMSNGWNESNVNEALSQASSDTQLPPLISEDLKNHKKKLIWKVFFGLAAADLVIIIGVKLLYGIWGFFGISPTSIIVRLLVIYLVATFATRTSSPQDTGMKTIGKVVGTIFLTICITIGVVFVGCWFLLAGLSFR